MFTAPSLAQAQTALAERLYDPTSVQWLAVENAGYITEALRVWAAWTSLWRDRATVTLVNGQTFYDLPTEIPALRGQTVTNWNLVTDLQYALLEPAAPGGMWTGTDQFDLAELNAAIQRRRDMFLRESGAVITQQQQIVAVPDASGQIAFDEAILILRRLAWIPDATQVAAPLIRDDTWSGTHYAPGWPSDTTGPYAFATSDTPPLTVQLIPPAVAAGTLDIVSINTGAPCDPAVALPLGIPNDWAWVVKYGALMDLLQGDGLALDPGRSAYCQARWEQGVASAQAASVVIAARLNGAPILLDALTDADRYAPLWQAVTGPVQTLLTSGQTLAACWPPPGGGVQTLTLDVVRNAPVPSLPGDILQVTADVYDAILDYAQHLALFKLGPGQLDASLALLARASGAAGVELRIQQASQPSRRPLLAQTVQEEGVNARTLPAVPVS